MKIASNIHRLGESSSVNSYLIEDGGEITIVDAGLPGFYEDIPRELAAMGRAIEDVRALVLTHGHSDHLGFAERLRTERNVPVWIHEADAAMARGETKSAGAMGKISLAPLLGFIWLGLRNGGLKRPVVLELSKYEDGATLDVPGSPKVTLVPGHSPGMSTLEMARHDAILVGDAFCTYAVTSGRRGPQIAPFTADVAQARESLRRLSGVSARYALPGHGEPWTEGIDEAIRIIDAAQRT